MAVASPSGSVHGEATTTEATATTTKEAAKDKEMEDGTTTTTMTMEEAMVTATTMAEMGDRSRYMTPCRR